MDNAKQFRCLVTETLIPDRAICDQYFTFQTVFYTRGSSYCCCRCAYDHEYFTYISDTGEINTEKFDRLAKAVESGYCEHAIKVENRDYLKETSVHSIHVAAALGLEEKVEAVVITLDEKRLPLRDWYLQHCKGTIFQLTPCDIGCLKHNEIILHFVDKMDLDKKIFYAKESVDNVFHIEESSLVEICFQENDIETLRALLDVVKANEIEYYELLFKCSLNDKFKEIECNRGIMFYPLLDPHPDTAMKKARDATSVGGLAVIYPLAVIYNQCDADVNSMSASSESIYHSSSYEVQKVTDILDQVWIAFMRPEFQRSIVVTNRFVTPNLNVIGKCLLRLLVKYNLSRDLVKKTMEQIPSLPNTMNDRNADGFTLLQSYIRGTSIVDISVVRALIDLGLNIDIPLAHTPQTCINLQENNSDGQSLLEYILNNRLVYKGFREVVELFLYENISLAKNELMVSYVIKRELMVSNFIKRYRPGEMSQTDQSIQPVKIIMDATPHEDIFPSLITLLIEAGFKYCLSDIEDALELFKDFSSIDNSTTSAEDPVENSLASMLRRKLRNYEHSFTQDPVKAYLQGCLSEPRPLMLRCRDVLRNQFPRRQIHRYVSVMDIPNRIRDFLLLKPILQKLPVDIQSESYNRRDQIKKPLSGNRHRWTRQPLFDNGQDSMRKSSSDNQYKATSSSSVNQYRSKTKSILKNNRSEAKCQIV